MLVSEAPGFDASPAIQQRFAKAIEAASRWCRDGHESEDKWPTFPLQEALT